MQLCGQGLRSSQCISSSSRSSSSSSRLHPKLLLRPQFAHLQRTNTRNIQLAAASNQPEQQPERSEGDLADIQQQQQQQLQQVEQQLQQQQEPPSARAAEADASAAIFAATATAAEADTAEQPSEEHAELQQQLQKEQQAWLQQHQQWCMTSRNVYLLLALGLTASGLLIAVGAGPIAAAGLKLGVGLQAPQAAVLVGCFGAAVVRAASLAWFLAEGAALGELGSWRYQRINLGLAVAALTAAAAAVTAGWAGAQPWLLLPLFGGCVATAGACLAMTFGQARHEGFYFASALGYGDIFEGCAATWGYLVYNVTCLAGALMTGIAVAGLVLGFGALTGSAVLPLLPWLNPASSGVAAATLLHKLLGSGLLLLALQAWALTEYASNGRDISPETSVKLIYVRTAEDHAVQTGLLGPAPVHAPMRRFDLLHLGFIAAAVAQGLWLAQGAHGGPGFGLLNLADPLWGSLFWGVMGTVAYLFVLAAKMDFSDVWLACLRVLDWAGGLVALGAGVLYVDWMWLSQTERS